WVRANRPDPDRLRDANTEIPPGTSQVPAIVTLIDTSAHVSITQTPGCPGRVREPARDRGQPAAGRGHAVMWRPAIRRGGASQHRREQGLWSHRHAVRV